MSIIWLPLQGEGGERPKAVRVGGWQSPSYAGIDPAQFDGWVGLRCDGLVVIDCDSIEASTFWREHSGFDKDCWVRKTPHGFHYIYEWSEGSPEAPDVDIFNGNPGGIDIRAGRTSQIVFRAPGYKTIVADELSRRYEP